MITEHDVQVGRARIRYVEDGAGDPPFLLIHGLGSSTAKWIDAMPSLAQVRRTIAVDLPGFGHSEPVAGTYSPAWLAGGVRAFMDAIGIEQAVVVGNSMGGLVATYLAAAAPERCAALVLVAPALPNDGPQTDSRVVLGFIATALPGIGALMQARYWGRDPSVVVAESLARNCADPTRISHATVKLLEADAARKARDPELRRASLAAQQQVMWALTGRRETTWDVLRAVKTPTLFLWGDKDKVLPLHIGHRAIKEVPGAHLIVIDDCGHNPQMEKPEEFASAVIAFTRAVDASEAHG